MPEQYDHDILRTTAVLAMALSVSLPGCGGAGSATPQALVEERVAAAHAAGVAASAIVAGADGCRERPVLDQFQTFDQTVDAVGGWLRMTPEDVGGWVSSAAEPVDEHTSSVSSAGVVVSGDVPERFLLVDSAMENIRRLGGAIRSLTIGVPADPESAGTVVLVEFDDGEAASASPCSFEYQTLPLLLAAADAGVSPSAFVDRMAEGRAGVVDALEGPSDPSGTGEGTRPPADAPVVLDPEADGGALLDDHVPFTTYLYAPVEWALEGYLLCNRVPTGWGTCVDLALYQTHDALPITGYRQPGAAVELVIVAEADMDEVLAVVASIGPDDLPDEPGSALVTTATPSGIDDLIAAPVDLRIAEEDEARAAVGARQSRPAASPGPPVPGPTASGP